MKFNLKLKDANTKTEFNLINAESINNEISTRIQNLIKNAKPQKRN